MYKISLTKAEACCIMEIFELYFKIATLDTRRMKLGTSIANKLIKQSSNNSTVK